MSRALRWVWIAAPCFALLMVLVLWDFSRLCRWGVEVHCRGPAYYYVTSCLGQIEVGRCADLENAWSGVRVRNGRPSKDEFMPVRTGAFGFELSFATITEPEAAGVAIPYWALCMALGLCPAWCAVRRWLGRRPRPKGEAARNPVRAAPLRRHPEWRLDRLPAHELLSGRARRFAPRVL